MLSNFRPLISSDRPKYWPLIGPGWSRDLNTDLWLVQACSQWGGDGGRALLWEAGGPGGAADNQAGQQCGGNAGLSLVMWPAHWPLIGSHLNTCYLPGSEEGADWQHQREHWALRASPAAAGGGVRWVNTGPSFGSFKLSVWPSLCFIYIQPWFLMLTIILTPENPSLLPCFKFSRSLI